MVKRAAGCLFELINLITLLPADNPQLRSQEQRKCAMMAAEASQVLPTISYSMFTEVLAKLDQNGSTFEAFLARQVSTLYFLLRLKPLTDDIDESATDKRLKMLGDEGEKDVISGEELFPKDLLEMGPMATANQLLANYLTEGWNWYTQHGSSRTNHEAIALSRLYFLVREVVKVYGWWAWPFLHHYDSSEHVDQMLKLVEEADDGRIPLIARQD